MTSRRSGYPGSMDSSASNSGGVSRKQQQQHVQISERSGMEPCYERKGDNNKAAYGASQGGMTVTSLKSRLGPTIQTAVSAAVDTLLGEVVLVLNETQQELLNKEQENERLKVRLEVSERELKTLQECLCSAQKLIDQLQISYSGSQSVGQSVFASSSLSSMASMTSSLDRDPQNSRNVNGASVDLGLGGSVDDSLHGFEPRDDYKMCQLSIQPDGSVTNHALDFGSGASHMCDSGRPDNRQSRGPAGISTFEIKEEQGPVSGSGQPSRKDPGLHSDSRVAEGEQSSHSVGDMRYGAMGGDEESQRAFGHPLRHHRSSRDCNSSSNTDRPKLMTRAGGAGGGSESIVSPRGAGEDSAGPSASDPAGDVAGERPHHCLECGKTFRLISSLKKHIRIHTGEKPYPCGVCGRRFRESGALKTHLRIHTGEKPYSCSECGNHFRHLDGLRKHRRTHTGEKPYVCAICGKRLSRLQHLKHHQLIHTGERPCCCPFCNRTFKEPAALRKHVRTHREEGGTGGAGGHHHHLGLGSDDTDPDAIDDMNNLHPAAPSPQQMRFGEWGPEEDDSSVVDCV